MTSDAARHLTQTLEPACAEIANRWRPNWVARYGIALGAVGIGTLIRWFVRPLLDDQAGYLLFIIVIASSAYVGGSGPAALGAILSASIAGSTLAEVSVADDRTRVAHLVLFGVESAVVILVIRRLQDARNQAHRALADVDAARRRAEEASRAKEQFVARVSHEWRGPLNTVSGWLSQLETRAVDRDFVLRATASMRHAVEAQNRLVSDILDYSRGTQGKLSIELERVTIANPVRRAIEATAAEAGPKQLDIRFCDRYGDTRVWGDPVRLESRCSQISWATPSRSPRLVESCRSRAPPWMIVWK
jgi:signal transduction histidine kinase